MTDALASVWVFQAGRLPSAVFSTRERAERWVSSNHLSGMLTEYPIDSGVYDWAVAQGFFQVSKPEQTSASFIEGFTTASQDHVHFTDGIAD